MNTIIFLDIDGVLCTLRSHFAFGHGLIMSAWDITCCQMLRQLCLKYNCKIVISSVWKKNKDITTYLCLYGLIDFVYSDIWTTKDWKTISLEGIRGNEIEAWLKTHEHNGYLILDDDSDFLPEQKEFLIHTNTDEGFSAVDYMKADKILKEINAEIEIPVYLTVKELKRICSWYHKGFSLLDLDLPILNKIKKGVALWVKN